MASRLTWTCGWASVSLTLVTAEMCLRFLAPVHFWYNKLAPMAHNALWERHTSTS